MPLNNPTTNSSSFVGLIHGYLQKVSSWARLRVSRYLAFGLLAAAALLFAVGFGVGTAFH